MLRRDAHLGRIAALVALAASVPGCASNTCLFTVNGQCQWSTCPNGAEYQSATLRCACRSDRVALGGSCLTPEQANQYCGRGSHAEPGGCVKNACPSGLTMDEETGYCLTAQQVAAVAASAGVPIGQGQKLGCPPGAELVVEGAQASCVPLQKTCGKDEQYDGQACRKIAQCPPGSTYDAASRGCIPFATQAKQKYTVALRTWMTATYGTDGGEGASTFCGAFAKHPLAFGVASGRTLPVRIAVQVQVPAGRIADAFVLTTAIAESNGQPVSEKGAAEIQAAATSALASLKAGMGEADQTMGLVSVKCVVVSASKPTAVTVTGGA